MILKSFQLQYETQQVPPGYTEWYGLHGNSKYYNYTLNENGKLKNYGDHENEYLTDVIVRDSCFRFSTLKHLHNFQFCYFREIKPLNLYPNNRGNRHFLLFLHHQHRMSHSSLPNVIRPHSRISMHCERLASIWPRIFWTNIG